MPIASFLLAAATYAVSGDAASELVFRTPTVAAAELPALERDVTRDAQARCGAKRAVAGRFSYETKLDRAGRPEAVTGYERHFTCVHSPASSPARVADDWRPTAEDREAASRVAASFFTAFDHGDSQAALAWVRPDAITPDVLAGDMAAFARTAAGLGNRTVDRLTWYVNPAAAPALGVYVALDYHGSYPGLDTYCGYLVLYREAPGRYRLTRQESGFLTKADTAKASPGQLPQLRAQLQCRP